MLSWRYQASNPGRNQRGSNWQLRNNSPMEFLSLKTRAGSPQVEMLLIRQRGGKLKRKRIWNDTKSGVRHDTFVPFQMHDILLLLQVSAYIRDAITCLHLLIVAKRMDSASMTTAAAWKWRRRGECRDLPWGLNAFISGPLSWDGQVSRAAERAERPIDAYIPMGLKNVLFPFCGRFSSWISGLGRRELAESQGQRSSSKEASTKNHPPRMCRPFAIYMIWIGKLGDLRRCSCIVCWCTYIVYCSPPYCSYILFNFGIKRHRPNYIYRIGFSRSDSRRNTPFRTND